MVCGAGLTAAGMKVTYLHPSGKVDSKETLMGGKKYQATWVPRNLLNEQLYTHVTSVHGDAVKVCILRLK